MTFFFYFVMLVEIVSAYTVLLWCSKEDALSNWKIRLGICGCLDCGCLQKEEFALSLASVGSLDIEDRSWDLKHELIFLVNIFIDVMLAPLGCLLIGRNVTCCIAVLSHQVDLYKLDTKNFHFLVSLFVGSDSAFDYFAGAKLWHMIYVNIINRLKGWRFVSHRV